MNAPCGATGKPEALFSAAKLQQQQAWAQTTQARIFFDWFVARARRWIERGVAPADAGLLPSMVTCIDWAGAYVLTGEAYFLAHLEAALLAYCAPREKHHAMVSGLVSTQLAMIDDLVGDALSAECRVAIHDRMLFELNILTATQSRAVGTETSLAFCNNILAIIASGILMSGYVLKRAGRDSEMPAEWLHAGRESLRTFMNTYYQIDGSTLEGPNYFFFGTEHALIAREALLTLTGFDAMQWGMLDRGRHFGSAHTVPLLGGNPASLPVGDCLRNKPQYAAVAVRLGTVFNDPSLWSMWRAAFLDPDAPEGWSPEGFEANTGRDHLLTLFWLTPEVITPDPAVDAALPRAHFYPWTGDVFMRTGWRRSDTLVQLHGGQHHPHCRWHYHHDHGSFTIAAGGEMLLDDPAVCSYTNPLYRGWYTTSRAHNCLTIDQRDQDRPFSVTVDHDAESDGLSVYSADLSFCYGGTPTRRTWVYLKPDVLIVFDSIAAAPYDAPCYFNLVGAPHCSISGQDGSWVVRGDRAAIGIHMIAPEPVLCERAFSPTHPEEGTENPILRLRTPKEYIEIRRQEFFCILTIAPDGVLPMVTGHRMSLGEDVSAFEIAVGGRPFRILGNPTAMPRIIPETNWSADGFHILPGFVTDTRAGGTLKPGGVIVLSREIMPRKGDAR